MLFSNFYNRIKKLNPRLNVKDEQVTHKDYQDFPVVGLYCDTKFLMAIPRTEVPEYSIYATNLTELARYNPEELKRIENTGFASTKEKMLWRGWKAILNGLIKQNLIDIDKTEKLFNFHYEPKRMEYPRNYINRPI